MELLLDLTPVEEPVTDRDGKVLYILREASEGDKCVYRNAQGKEIKVGPDGTPAGVGNMSDTESLLVSLCLYVPDENGKIRLTDKGVPNPVSKVSPATVKSWPARAVKKLFERAREISELEETESKERKALLAALQREDAPVTLADFRTFAETLKGEDRTLFLPLWKLVTPTDGEQAAKNGRAATTATSA